MRKLDIHMMNEWYVDAMELIIIIIHLAKLNLRTMTYDVVLYFKTDTNRLKNYSPPIRLLIGCYMSMVREN